MLKNKAEIQDSAEEAKENLKTSLIEKADPEYIILDSGDGHQTFIDPKTQRIRFIRMPAKEWREMGINPGDNVPDGELIRYEIVGTHDKEGQERGGPKVHKLQ